MKLAEMLINRKDLQVKLRQLNEQMLSNVKVQEGDEPNALPEEIIAKYEKANDALKKLITKINLVNAKTTVAKYNDSLTTVIEIREALKREYSFVNNAISRAEERENLYSRSEIKHQVTIDLKKYYKQRDDLAKQIREYDIAIQETNWMTEVE
jgi:predicted RND superfamily exporter protein